MDLNSIIERWNAVPPDFKGEGFNINQITTYNPENEEVFYNYEYQNDDDLHNNTLIYYRNSIIKKVALTLTRRAKSAQNIEWKAFFVVIYEARNTNALTYSVEVVTFKTPRYYTFDKYTNSVVLYKTSKIEVNSLHTNNMKKNREHYYNSNELTYISSNDSQLKLRIVALTLNLMSKGRTN